jgi:hypothetical protein
MRDLLPAVVLLQRLEGVGLWPGRRPGGIWLRAVWRPTLPKLMCPRYGGRSPRRGLIARHAAPERCESPGAVGVQPRGQLLPTLRRDLSRRPLRHDRRPQLGAVIGGWSSAEQLVANAPRESRSRCAARRFDRTLPRAECDCHRDRAQCSKCLATSR